MYLRSIITASLGSIICLSIGVSAASAQGYSWTGFSLYGGVGGAILDGNVGLTDTTSYSLEIECESARNVDPTGFLCIDTKGPLSAVNSNSIVSALNGDVGVLGTVGVGADLEATPGVVLGAFADIEWSNADANFSGSNGSTIKSLRIKDFELFNLSSTTNVSGSMDIDYSYTFGGRIGFLTINRQALLYVLGGYTRLEMDSASAQVQNTVDFSALEGLINAGYSANPISVQLPKSFDGYTVGVGGQVKLAQGWSLKLEGRYTDLESKSVSYSGKTVQQTSDVTKFGCSFLGLGKCNRTVSKTASSSGVINVDPDLWSGRVLLSMDF